LICHVEPPDNWRDLPARPKGFVSALVYKNGSCIGYLDRDGAFILPNDSDARVIERELNLVVILFGLELLSGLVFVIASVALFVKGGRSRTMAIEKS
jgi:hypothetical protein